MVDIHDFFHRNMVMDMRHQQIQLPVKTCQIHD